jgi:translation initiation factor IF-2
VIGFNVKPDRNAAAAAEREKIDVRPHSIIYEVTDEIKKAMMEEYGNKRGEQVFYASRNKGTIKGVDFKRRKMK